MYTIPRTCVSGTENLETYLVPCQASMMQRFVKIIYYTQIEKLRKKTQDKNYEKQNLGCIY